MGDFFDIKFTNPKHSDFLPTFRIDLINKNTKAEDLKISRNKSYLDIIQTLDVDPKINFPLATQDALNLSIDRIYTENNKIPIINFNCHNSLKNKVIIIPLYGVENITTNNKKLDDWDKKNDKVIWRGSPTGTIYCNKPSYFTSIFKYFLKNEENMLTSLIPYGYQRFRFIELFKDNNDFDIGFTNNSNFNINDFPNKKYNSYFKDYLNHKEIATYKYTVIIEGNDWATCLPHCFLNNMCCFIPDINFRGVFNIGLIPWYHYIPIKYDFSDLTEKIHFISKNPQIGKIIAKNGFTYIKEFFNRNACEIIKKIFIKYAENTILE